MEERAHLTRRKQANPRRKNVFSDALIRGGRGSEEDETPDASPRVGHALLHHEGSEVSWSPGDDSDYLVGARQPLGVSQPDDYFSGSAPDDAVCHPAAIAEYLERSDTAVIYPQAPEDLTPLSTPEGASHGEDPPPGDPAGPLSCPFCQHAYESAASLKDHIKCRHHRGAELYVCRLCGHAFSQCTQLQCHMTTHQPISKQVSHHHGAENRKFKCGECGKAFKYKHHLKEHLRIHSGEKPYECSNCKKRFSHSGSYSSHISSRKCVGLIVLNGRAQNKTGSSTKCSASSPSSPGLAHLHQKIENGQHHQQNCLNVKSESMDICEYRLRTAPQQRFGGPEVYDSTFTGIHGSSHSPLRPLPGLGIDFLLPGTLGSLNDVQKVLQIVDSTVSRQKMNKNPEEVSKLRAYMKELGVHMEEQIIGQSSPVESFIDSTADMVKEVEGVMEDSRVQQTMDPGSKERSSDSPESLVPHSCQFCKETFTGPIPLHQHERYLCKMNKEIQAVLQPAQLGLSIFHRPEASEWLLSKKESGTSHIHPFQDHMSVLKAYSAENTEPDSDELLKISLAVGLPQELVRDWFNQWKKPIEDNWSDQHHSLRPSPMSLLEVTNSKAFPAQFSASRPGNRTPDHLDHSSPSPLNLSCTSSKHSQSNSDTPNGLVVPEEFHGDTPLDLSVPKQLAHAFLEQSRPDKFKTEAESEPRVSGKTLRPSGLADTKNEVLGSDLRHIGKKSPIFGVNPFSAGPVYSPLPPHGAFPPPTFMSPTQATYPALDSINFLPQMTFAYASRAATFPDSQQTRKKLRRASLQGAVDYLQHVTDSEVQMKKTEGGMYTCDLCDKTFQKTSSLLRHKYEHTGKRPHQCHICSKAFKHKHHLIEHSRLHSGEKPYQCDKCGKRFSHSGSYSQHMNHRYSYCKREAEERQAGSRAEPQEPRAGPDGNQEAPKEDQVRLDSTGDGDEDKV
ncbi:zinc finger E-box-binding homeobox 2-like [Entelurus aequoreus]|uniref:zinc finger E-box-binding homeobox 2-like n=1 Tax=Entelurus aequoreus TaxID=161455 RepID=UPI002B1D5BE6|nr:zinc finger E-box-binding homeobox 2-like [Entelurus aequoreus]